jgi:hypothetical protein
MQLNKMREHISLNKAVVEILEEAVVGKKNPPPRYHDLDWMCGAITERQSVEFPKHFVKTRIIDKELWQ